MAALARVNVHDGGLLPSVLLAWVMGLGLCQASLVGALNVDPIPTVFYL